jgi:hypothetical protein
MNDKIVGKGRRKERPTAKKPKPQSNLHKSRTKDKVVNTSELEEAAQEETID